MKILRWGRFAKVVPVLRFAYGVAWQTSRPYFVWTFIQMLVRGSSPFINIVIPKFLIDELLAARRVEMIVLWVAILVAANFLVAMVMATITQLINKHRTRIEMRLESMINGKAMAMDFEYTENVNVLTQLEKARTGLSWYSGGIGGLTESISGVLSGCITFAGTIFLMLHFSPWLILILLLVAVCNGLLVSKSQALHVQFMKGLVRINRRSMHFGSLMRDFRFAKDIRMFGGDALVAKRMQRYIDNELLVEIKKTGPEIFFELAVLLLNAVQLALIYGYLALAVIAKAIGVGDFLMLALASRSFTDSLNDIIRKGMDLAKTADFIDESRVFLNYPSSKPTGIRKILDRDRHIFTFEKVSFKYPQSETLVLDSISVTIPTGQRLSIVGENGAGKTTFVKLLCRLYDPTEGRILLDGIDIREYDLNDYIQTFAVVFQDFKLMALSVGENIAVAPKYEIQNLHSAVEKAGVSAKIHALKNGFDTAVTKNFDETGVEFSGGEAQKLAIARAIYRNSPVVILDEPTAALDPVAEYEIFHRFDHLMGDKTAIYISHRLSSCRFCDTIVVFEGGKITQSGTHQELVQQDGKYLTMWKAQAQYYQEIEEIIKT